MRLLCVVLAAILSDGVSSPKYPAAFGDAVEGLDAERVAAFEQGKILFEHYWSPDDGRGEEFNAASCMACHREPMPGGSATIRSDFVRVLDRSDRVEILHKYVRADTPLAATPFQALRKPPALFGIGLLAAVPESYIRARAEQMRGRDGVRGIVPDGGRGRIGRFGWRAQFATLDDVVRAAAINEIGLRVEASGGAVGTKTQSRFLSESQIANLITFVEYLAIPPRKRITARALIGEKVFNQIGCDLCHSPTMQTGDAAPPTLANRILHPYTDMLVHDVGTCGGAGIAYRTAPLWGISSTGPPYLHDGRAADLPEAITMHRGEASMVVGRYSALPDHDKSALIAFLESL